MADQPGTSGTRRTRRTAPTRTKPKPKPAPNRVEPGWVHEAAAEGTLKFVRDALGVDVGEVKDVTDVVEDATPEDGRELAEILARVYAHIGHRLPLVKRIEKRLEGQDA